MPIVRWLLLWFIKIFALLAVLSAVVYMADWGIYRMRGSPQSKVTVNRFVSIPEKARKTELDFLGTLDAPCAIAIFSQDGETACWRLRRNPDVGIESQ